jgi:hypothetical protein
MNKNDASLGIDIFLHILILFSFLTIFFFAYISKLEKQNLDATVNNSVIDKTDGILSQIDTWQKKLEPQVKINIDWEKLNNISKNLVETSKEETPEIKKNNSLLFRNSIIAIVVLFILFIGITITLKYVFHYNINLKHILIMNIVVFSITGLIEFLFFNFVASKYVPVVPTDISGQVINTIKTKIVS